MWGGTSRNIGRGNHSQNKLCENCNVLMEKSQMCKEKIERKIVKVFVLGIQNCVFFFLTELFEISFSLKPW